MSDDYIQQHTARIEFHNKVEYAIFYEKTGIQLDSDETYPSLESAQWSLDHEPDRDQLVIYQRPTPKEWGPVR
jgi:hypothetical protein